VQGEATTILSLVQEGQAITVDSLYLIRACRSDQHLGT
jgi:hypothetical protein